MNIQSIQSTRIARFGSGGTSLRSQFPMDDGTILRVAPSIFAEGKHESRSEKFTYIPTIDVVNGLRGEGWGVVEVRQGGSRDEGNRGFTKHLLRLVREGESLVAGEARRELILLNAHDGTSSYRLLSGLFRMVCSNGLVVADGMAQELRIPHKGDVIHDVIEGAYTIIRDGEAVDNAVQEMKAIDLTPDEQGVFAAAAAELRFDEGQIPDRIAGQINRPRRSADAGADIWRTFNRAQENLIRGGLNYVHTSEDGRRTHRQTRPVNSIDGSVSLNRGLWTLAQGMERLKRGEPAASVIARPPAFA